MNEILLADTLLGSRIAQARYGRGWTAAELAQRIGVKAVTIENWESERASPRANRLAQLAGVLNVPLLWLVGGVEAPSDIIEPVLDETARIQEKLRRVEALVNELSQLMHEVRADVSFVQRELDAE
ncbi:MAG: helix-turn-helix transcriptional regulator [Granulosicoccus sp.]